MAAIARRALEPGAGLDHHQAQRPLPRAGAQRPERADPLGRVAAGGDRGGRLLGALDHRHDHALRAEVERLADRERLVAGDAHQRRGAGAGDRGQHRHQRGRVQRAVLLVGDHVVRAGQRGGLGGQRGRDRRPQADRRPAGLELLAQAHGHEASPQDVQSVTRSSAVRRLTTPLPSASTNAPRRRAPGCLRVARQLHRVDAGESETFCRRPPSLTRIVSPSAMNDRAGCPGTCTAAARRPPRTGPPGGRGVSGERRGQQRRGQCEKSPAHRRQHSVGRRPPEPGTAPGRAPPRRRCRPATGPSRRAASRPPACGAGTGSSRPWPGSRPPRRRRSRR